MLGAIGVGSIEDLFADIPQSVRLDREIDLPPGLSEQEVHDHLAALAARNRHADAEVSFLGAGMYDHYVPALIDNLLSRSEFLTPYTPYQPEISQGGLQVMFEFQTAISELTGLPVSNASVYEGPSAVAAAGYLAKLETRRTKLVASRGLHPHSRAALSTHAVGYGMEVEEVPLTGEGATDVAALAAAVDEDTAAVFVQQPNFLGTVEELGELAEAGARTGALVVCAADPLSLGILKPPGEQGVDICVGEGQTLGNRLDFGGPSFGFFAAAERFLRKMPGRIAGETRDLDGKRGFVLTLQTREQHIRREKATHNICTAQALNALAGVVYLSWLGKRGLVELAELMLRRTHHAREALGLEAINPGPVVREFAVRVPDLDALFERARAERVNPGYRLGRDYPEYGDGLLVAITERRTREDIDRLAAVGRRARGGGGVTELDPRAGDEAVTIFERSSPGRRAFVAPELDVPEVPVSELLPASQVRERPAELPEISEPELVRHYVTLSSKNFHLDEGFYPLGSCTMKHNPKLHERVAALPGHARLHPLQDPEYAQGALELMWRLQGALAEIAGLPHVSLQPSAGSHGELAGLLLTRAYHEDRGEHKTKVLTPDTAHGTNPATVTMAGYEVVKVGTADDGGVDLDDLRAKATDDVACLMLTNPNTLGLFDRNIEEIARIVHDAGATLYYDGANLNAIMGIARPGDMGFDIVHYNLHKTFTQPHGGGGPGAGPIAVSDRIEPFLPIPQVLRRGGDNGAGRFVLDHDRPKSIGKLRGFQGNFGVFVRSYAYICSLGADGLKDASQVAVLNANYLKARLAEPGIAEYLPIAFDRTCMHEFVLSGRGAKEKLGVRTLDLAKRMLDHGVHPPTVYFPLLVDEALMIEPTETETRERLDGFADVVRAILEEAASDPDIARNAPYTTPVRRLDEAAAAKRPVVRWSPSAADE